MAGCAVEDSGPSVAARIAREGSSFHDVATLAPGHRDAMARAGARAVAFGRDGQALLVRYDGSVGGAAALPTVAQLSQVDARDLQVRSTATDRLGRTVTRYQQRAQGLLVHGAELVLHTSPTGALIASVSTLRSVAPVVAILEVGAAEQATRAGYAALVDGTAHAVGLAFAVDPAGATRLCREVLVTGTVDGVPVRDRVFVDARSGDVVRVHPEVHSAQDRRTYSAGGSETLPGALRLTENQTTSGDATIDTLHANVGKAYACASALFGRDSFDDGGATLHTTGHVGQGYVNAFWDGSQLAFGDGDGDLSGPLIAFDIVAHELAHAITQATAGLVYQRESGALNEALSDIFSAMCDIHERGSAAAATWDLGEEVWTPGQPGDALRYMASPTDDGVSTDHTSVMPPCGAPNQNNDYCGVHTNSGVPNLMFKLLVTGGTHPRGGTGSISASVQVPALGIERAQAIAYLAWTSYLGDSTDFAGARAAFRQAAEDLYADEAGTQAAVELAWYAVGVGGAIANLPTGVGDPNPAGGGGGGGDDGGTDAGGGTDDGVGTDDGATDDPADPDGVTHISGCSAGGAPGGSSALLVLAGVLGAARRRRRIAR